MPRGVKKTGRFQVETQNDLTVVIDTETPQVIKVPDSDEVEEGPPLVVERYTGGDAVKYAKARAAELNDEVPDAEVAPDAAAGSVPPDGAPAQ